MKIYKSLPALGLLVLVSGCGNSDFPVPQELYDEYKSIMCRDKTGQRTLEDVQRQLELNKLIIGKAAPDNRYASESIRSEHLKRWNEAIYTGDCDKVKDFVPGNKTGNAENSSSSGGGFFASLIAFFSGKPPQCDLPEATSFILDDVSKKVSAESLGTLSASEARKYLTVSSIRSTSNSDSAKSSCAANVDIKLPENYSQIFIATLQTDNKTDYFINKWGVSSAQIPGYIVSELSPIMMKVAFNIGTHTKSAEDQVKEAFAEFSKFSIPVSYTLEKGKLEKIPYEMNLTDQVKSGIYFLSYTVNFNESDKEKTKSKAEDIKPADEPRAATEQPAPQKSSTNAVETAGTTVKASFDCTKASSTQEKLICSSPSLGEADIKLSQAYKAALQKSSDPDQLKKDQIAWMKNVRNSCTDQSCLISTINNRISSLVN